MPIELLAPAGNFEKLEIAIHYGADAVYLGGKNFSLRNFSGNFTLDEMKQAVALAHQHQVKAYVTCNIYPRSSELDPIRDYLYQLKDIMPDALIIADPGIFTQAREIAPEIPVHISTQANITSAGSAMFWQRLGARRINMARELSLKEIREIGDACILEMEAFVHGSMCMAYSGRCLLSSFMAGRDGNRGLCCQPCRFRYAVVEEKRPGQYFPFMEDDRGSYLFNSKDLCMIAHIPEMTAAGIHSLKIEGRMKGINYLASVVKTYRQAIDAFYAAPDHYTVQQEWIDELNRVNYRGYGTGFYFGDLDPITPNYEECSRSTPYAFAGKILEKMADNRFRAAIRNKIRPGDSVEILSPKEPLKTDCIGSITDENGFPLEAAQPNATVIISLSAECSVNDLIRKTHELIFAND
jgi:putative protease